MRLVKVRTSSKDILGCRGEALEPRSFANTSAADSEISTTS